MDLATRRAVGATRKHTACQPQRYAFPSSIGQVELAWRDDVVIACSLEREVPGRRVARPPTWIAALAERIQAHLGGEPQDFRDVPVDLSELGPFQRQALTALRDVPPGRTVSYGELAEQLGRPGAARAVGGAMRRNHVLLIVPCHRVLTSGGGLGGFSGAGGVPTKRALLAIERVVL